MVSVVESWSKHNKQQISHRRSGDKPVNSEEHAIEMEFLCGQRHICNSSYSEWSGVLPIMEWESICGQCLQWCSHMEAKSQWNNGIKKKLIIMSLFYRDRPQQWVISSWLSEYMVLLLWLLLTDSPEDSSGLLCLTGVFALKSPCLQEVSDHRESIFSPSSYYFWVNLKIHSFFLKYFIDFVNFYKLF